MNCNRLSTGALFLVLMVSLAGLAMAVKGAVVSDALHFRFDPEVRFPSAAIEIHLPGDSL